MTFDPTAQGWRPMETNPMPSGLGIPWAKRVDGVWRYGMLTASEHANPDGVLHGGVLMLFADHTMGLYVWEASNRVPSVTIQLNTHFLASVTPGEFLELRGEVTRSSKNLVFVRALVAAGGRDIGAIDGIWKVFPK